MVRILVGRTPFKQHDSDAHKVGPKELEEVCQGSPEALFIGASREERLELTDDGQCYGPRLPMDQR